ncbi:MAG TPA: hypothetical protein VML55_20290, partial [Planctomycetaceae bacterium]|nr:hypothetical protein [Planctomycetaceae bacterium]
HLRRLVIWGGPTITADGLHRLVEVEQLDFLDMRWLDHLDGAARERITTELQKGLPDCKIVWDGNAEQATADDLMDKELAEPPSVPGEYALRFDGVDDYVHIASLVLEEGKPITIEAEAIAETAPESSGAAVANVGGGMLALSAQQWGKGKPYWAVIGWGVDGPDAGKGVSLSSSPDSFAVHRRIHIAGVYDGQAISLFIDGRRENGPMIMARDGQPTEVTGPVTLRKMPLVTGTTLGASDAYQVRKRLPKAHPLAGIIRELRVSSVARYSEDFTPAQRFEPDEHTLALYRFDEAEGDVLVDSSGNGHDGKIVGATWVKEVAPGKYAPYDADRRTAEWVSSRGGRVVLQMSGARQVTVEAGEALPNEPFQLMVVVLDGAEMSDLDLVRLTNLKRLTGLYLTDVPVSDEGLRHIGEIGSLHQLGLGRTRVTDGGMKHVARLRELRHLFLDAITDSAMPHIGELTDLQILGLAGAQVTDSGMQHLARLQKLSAVWLGGCKGVGDDGIAALAHLPELVSLGLDSTSISDIALETIGRMEQLEDLGVSSTTVSDSGVKHLGKLHQLKTLALHGTRVTDEALVTVGQLRSLNKLLLGGAGITDAGLKHLERSAQLAELYLWKTAVTAKGVAELQDVLPDCKIIWDGSADAIPVAEGRAAGDDADAPDPPVAAPRPGR